MLKENDFIPDFQLPVTSGEEKIFEDLVGSKGLVIFFYPKDLTPGCTQEVADFQEKLKDFSKYGFHVVGVSKDSVKRHQKFSEKKGLHFPLIADEEGELCEFFGVWKEKKLYGKTFMGIERSTFITDSEGCVLYAQGKVRVAGHVDAVLKKVIELSDSR